MGPVTILLLLASTDIFNRMSPKWTLPMLMLPMLVPHQPKLDFATMSLLQAYLVDAAAADVHFGIRAVESAISYEMELQEMHMYKEVCYYMHFALAAYGWPLYLMRNPTCGLCKLASSCSCCCFCLPRPRYAPSVTVEEDNCCNCNVIAIKRHFLDENFCLVDIVYTSCHDAVFETPFFVAVDHMKKKVVISIRGTLSPKDALTDLTGDAERLPVEGHHGTWLGHKGMVLSAEYIKKKLEQEMILSQAFGRDLV
ncbi:diacylglycerol lipase-alpha, partial [Rhincodon typus]|uniref:diacylglycerol lipase-alpha n=1 Tax=Rhincodon typus TaxID=259920 RepID=UPI00202FF927